MSALQVYVEGVGLWSSALGDFAALKAQLAGLPVPPRQVVPVRRYCRRMSAAVRRKACCSP